MVLFADVLAKVKKAVQYICRINFEVYLYHYMFVVGPISIMHLTNSWVLNSILVIIVTVIIANIMNKINKMISDRLKYRFRI